MACPYNALPKRHHNMWNVCSWQSKGEIFTVHISWTCMSDWKWAHRWRRSTMNDLGRLADVSAVEPTCCAECTIEMASRRCWRSQWWNSIMHTQPTVRVYFIIVWTVIFNWMLTLGCFISSWTEGFDILLSTSNKTNATTTTPTTMNYKWYDTIVENYHAAMRIYTLTAAPLSNEKNK